MHATRSVLLAVLVLLLASCGSGDGTGADVLAIEDILATEITVEPDPSGTVATLRVETEVPVVCAVVYGTDDGFGLIATDDDMAGGAHADHSPRLSGLRPDTEYRYRLQGSDADGNLYRSDVMTFRTPAADAASTPGENVAPGGEVAAVSSEFSDDFVARNAIDGDLATEWSTAGDGDDASLTVDLGRERSLVGARLRTRQMSDGSAMIRSYTVTVDGQTFGPFEAGGVATFDAEGSRVRFDAEETTGGNTGAVEIEIFAAG